MAGVHAMGSLPFARRLDLHVHDGELRFRDPATGENLRTYDQAEERGDAEKARADVLGAS